MDGWDLPWPRACACRRAPAWRCRGSGSRFPSGCRAWTAARSRSASARLLVVVWVVCVWMYVKKKKGYITIELWPAHLSRPSYRYIYIYAYLNTGPPTCLDPPALAVRGLGQRLVRVAALSHGHTYTCGCGCGWGVCGCRKKSGANPSPTQSSHAKP